MRRHGPAVGMGRASWLLLAWLLLLPGAQGQDLRCADCGRAISGRYWKHDNQNICGACHQKRLPHCEACGVKITGRYLTSDGKTYCSQTCFESSLPTCSICRKPVTSGATLRGIFYCDEHAKLPRCTACDLPQTRATELPDGRLLCAICQPNAVMEDELAQRIYERAVLEFRQSTGYTSATLPPMQLVDATFLRNKRKELGGGEITDAHMVERGLYCREELTLEHVHGAQRRQEVKVTEVIYLLSAVRRRDFAVVAVHELCHDMLRESYPDIENAPAWVEEGICQYVAAIVARRIQADVALDSIESMNDPVYGQGYRYFRKRFGADNWTELKAWLQTANLSRLPPTPPAQ